MCTVRTNCAAMTVARRGRCDEWHLVLAKAFRHITLGFASWFSEKAIVLGPPFSETRFVPIGSIGDAVDGDRVE